MKTFFALVGVVALLAFGFMVLGVLVGIHSSGSQNTTSANDGATVVTQTELRALPVQAERLFLDYQRNEVAADQKYRGRRLLVTGIVTSVNKDFTDKVYLMLGTSNMFFGVHASLEPSEVGRAGELSKGEGVTVLCSGGMMVVDSPMLDDCIFRAAPVENEAPGPTYSPQRSNEQQQATVPVIDAVNIATAPPPVPTFRQRVDEYEDQTLRTCPMSFKIAEDGRVYDAVVNTPSVSTDLGQSCLEALNQVEQMGADADRPGARSGFRLSYD
jgi:tRNA_anti-like